MEEEKDRLWHENITLREQLKERYSFYNIVGRSNKMREVFEMIDKVSASDASVLIRGESGTLNLVAQAKILRALQEKELERVGGDDTIKVDVRIITAGKGPF